MGQPIKYTNHIKCRFCYIAAGFSSDYGQEEAEAARHCIMDVMATETRPIRDPIRSASTAAVTSFSTRAVSSDSLKGAALPSFHFSTTITERVAVEKRLGAASERARNNFSGEVGIEPWVCFLFTPNPTESIVRFSLGLSA